MPSLDPRLARVLELARWAPSGDNTQPWRIEAIDRLQLRLHAFDTRTHCVYDLDGRPSQMSVGAWIETAAIAASGVGLALAARRLADSPESNPVFDICCTEDPLIQPSLLLAMVPRRSVNRRPYSMQPLHAAQKTAIETSVGPGYRLRWFESPAERMRWAVLLWRNAGLRLRLPEAFETHRSVIEWNARYSQDRIPDQALGVDAMTIRLMRFAMHSWRRVDLMNRWLGGTIAPRIQMDFWPALACAAHVAIIADVRPQNIDDHVAAGRAMQRFWLAATAAGLQHQPALTPLVFARYAREEQPFARDPAHRLTASRLGRSLDRLLGPDAPNAVWLGRIGRSSPMPARSLRLPVEKLQHPPHPDQS